RRAVVGPLGAVLGLPGLLRAGRSVAGPGAGEPAADLGVGPARPGPDPDPAVLRPRRRRLVPGPRLAPGPGAKEGVATRRAAARPRAVDPARAVVPVRRRQRGPAVASGHAGRRRGQLGDAAAVVPGPHRRGIAPALGPEPPDRALPYGGVP